ERALGALEREVRGGVAHAWSLGHGVEEYGSRGPVDPSQGRCHRQARRARARGAGRRLLAERRRPWRAGGRRHRRGARTRRGDVLALGVLRALATRPECFAEAALLLVVDEEWRVGPFAHVERFGGFDACLCFEAGELGPDGHDAVVVKRKAAGTVDVTATGRN